MIAAIATPIPMIPVVATTRISGASRGSRFRPLGIITSASPVALPPLLRFRCGASCRVSGFPSLLLGPIDTDARLPAPGLPHAALGSTAMAVELAELDSGGTAAAIVW